MNELVSSSVPPRLRPIDGLFRGVGQLIKAQWEIWLVAKAIAMGLILVLVFGLIGSFALPIALLIPAIKGIFSGQPLPLIVAAGFFIICCFGYVVMYSFVNLWSQVAVTLGLAYGERQKAPLGVTLVQGLRPLLRMLGLILLAGLILWGALMFFFVPFFFVAPGLILAWYIAVLEDCPIRESLAMSWERTRGHRLAIVGRYLLFWLLVLGVFLLLALVAIIPILGTIVAMPLNFLLQLLLPVLTLALGYVIYVDLKPVTPVVSEDTGLGVLYFFLGWGLLLWVLAVGGTIFFLLRASDWLPFIERLQSIVV